MIVGYVNVVFPAAGFDSKVPVYCFIADLQAENPVYSSRENLTNWEGEFWPALNGDKSAENK